MRSITRLIGMLLIAIAVLGGLATIVFPSDEQRLITSSVEVKGRVLEKWFGEPKQPGTFKRSYNFISYEYSTGAGSVIRGELSLWTSSQREAIKVGGPLVIRYLPDNPRVHEVVDYRDQLSATRTLWGRLLMCVLLLVMGGGVLAATRSPTQPDRAATLLGGAGGNGAAPAHAGAPRRQAGARAGPRRTAQFSTRAR